MAVRKTVKKTAPKATRKAVRKPRAKKFSQHVKKFDITPFHYDLEVIISDSVQESRTRYNDILGYYTPDPNNGALHCWNREGYTSYIFLKYGADIGSVVHEAFHFVWRLFEYIGADHNNEVMAYYVGHYAREIAMYLYEVSRGKIPKTTKTLKST